MQTPFLPFEIIHTKANLRILVKQSILACMGGEVRLLQNWGEVFLPFAKTKQNKKQGRAQLHESGGTGGVTEC